MGRPSGTYMGDVGSRGQPGGPRAAEQDAGGADGVSSGVSRGRGVSGQAQLTAQVHRGQGDATADGVEGRRRT
eukprot:3676615-Pyramimonas_sp.AAC.1